MNRLMLCLSLFTIAPHVFGSEAAQAPLNAALCQKSNSDLSPFKFRQEAVSPDGRYRLRANNDGSVTRTDTQDGDIRVLTPPLDARSLCGTWGCRSSSLQAVFSRDGSFAVTSSSDMGGDTLVWDTEFWEIKRTAIDGRFILSPSNTYLAVEDESTKFGDRLAIMHIPTGRITLLAGFMWGSELGDDSDTLYEVSGFPVQGEIEWYSHDRDSYRFLMNNDLLTVDRGDKRSVVYDPASQQYSVCE